MTYVFVGGSCPVFQNTVCFDVFKEVSSDPTIEIIFFSPLSLPSALAVVFFGARGDGASQMEKVCQKHTCSHVWKKIK